MRGAVVLIVAALIATPADTRPAEGLIVERAVLVMRHGIRAPLPGEIPGGTRTGAPWPRWSVADSKITAHGARALALVAQADRRLLADGGLLDATGCPATGTVRIRSNSSDRTIASGEAYARGFAPSCSLAIEHLPLGEADPLFEPLRARATRFDARAAIASITRETGSAAALAHRHRAALAALDDVLGCRPRGDGCVPSAPAAVTPDAAGHEIALSGPIRATSGIAQVLLLQYVEGMPASAVGWGRADAATITRLGALHAALFAVFTRPPYMAAHQAAALGRRMLATLTRDDGPRLEVLMGHDTNVTALAAALRIDLKAPSYATNDVPPGGAVLLERVRDRRTGQRYIRLFYRTQSLDDLRMLEPKVDVAPMRIAGCAELCPTQRFAAYLRAGLAGIAD
jgi:4-phytase/acid phosphatase